MTLQAATGLENPSVACPLAICVEGGIHEPDNGVITVSDECLGSDKDSLGINSLNDTNTR